MTPIYSQDGQLVSLSKIVRDLTEQKRTADALQSAVKSSLAADNMKLGFIANMSHEIRTPLGVILGFTEILKDPHCAPEDRTTAAAAIDRNGNVLLRLIDDLLDISKLDAGTLEIEVSRISLQNLLREVVDSFEPQARIKGVLITLQNDSEAPDIISSDPARLRQILSNVIGKSLKFTVKGEITIAVQKLDMHDGITNLECVIADSSSGLTTEERKALFFPFGQVDRTVTRTFGGTGLGLALSRRLAEKLGGDLALSEFVQGGGCTFRVTFADMNAAYLVKNEKPVSKPTDRKLDQNRTSRFAGAKILVVDDSPDNQLLLKMLLDKWSILTEFSKNGLEAVERASRFNYDLILMDIQMPLMDGNEAIRTLRRSGYRFPIVAVTAHTMNEERAKSFDAGCDDYLIKPIDVSRLLEILGTYIKPKGHYRPPLRPSLRPCSR